MDKMSKAAQVNSSYTIFFILSTFGLAYFFSGSFGELKDKSFIVIALYALLIYFLADFMKQLFSAGQSVILLLLGFAVLPAILSLTISNKIPISGFIIWLGATLIAGVLELIYEVVINTVAPKRVLKSLLALDGRLDSHLVKLNAKNESHFNLRSVTFGLMLIAIYCICAYLLFV